MNKVYYDTVTILNGYHCKDCGYPIMRRIIYMNKRRIKKLRKEAKFILVDNTINKVCKRHQYIINFINHMSARDFNKYCRYVYKPSNVENQI